MIKLLKNAQVYAPASLGRKDLLIVGEKICRIDDRIEGYDGLPDVEVFDLAGKLLVPGYIDLHVHITGGGGEQGPASRVPESQLSAFTTNGITTVMGLLGTDGVTRSVENLVAKARALTEEGITVYCLTGSYGYPSTTITGSVEKDIMMIPPIIGVKVAVSDHRSSNPAGEDLIALASAARRAGLLSGTPGLVTMHMGAGKGGLGPVFDALDHSDIPARNLLPTHMLRTPELVDQGTELVRRGLPLEEALKLLTSTPAEVMGKTGRKGCVAPGADADLLILGDGLEIDSLFARGKTALWQEEVLMKGRFE